MQTMKRSMLWARGTVRMAAGCALIGFGAAGAIVAGFGLAPFGAFIVGVGDRAGWTPGTATIVINVAAVACGALLGRRPGIGALAATLVMGPAVDVGIAILAGVPDALVVVRAAVWGVAVAVSAVGIVLVSSHRSPTPLETLTAIAEDRTGASTGRVRLVTEAALVAAAFTVSGPLGPGTLLWVLALPAAMAAAVQGTVMFRRHWMARANTYEAVRA